MAEITVHYEGPIVTRDEAKAAGLKRFFTNVACMHGHVAERFVSSKNCVICVDGRKKAFREANPGSQKEEFARYWSKYGDLRNEKRREELPPVHCKQCGKLIPFPDELAEGYKKRTRRFYCSIDCRYWSKVDRRGDDECWGWNGTKHYFGYGMFGIEVAGETEGYTAHTVSWVIANKREVPPGMDVMHSCDNPECSNPAHLSIGTRQDNVDDMVQKGRNRKGETSPVAKLTEAQVRAIRSDPRPQSVIAAEHGIIQQTVSNIKTRKIWRHVE